MLHLASCFNPDGESRRDKMFTGGHDGQEVTAEFIIVILRLLLHPFASWPQEKMGSCACYDDQESEIDITRRSMITRRG